MKSHLAVVIIQYIEFLALASDEDVNPDVAIRQLENTALLLKHAPENQLADFFEAVQDRIRALEKETPSSAQLEVLRNIREHLGL